MGVAGVYQRHDWAAARNDVQGRKDRLRGDPSPDYQKVLPE